MNKPHLLVVEDDYGVRTTLVNMLELEGYQVEAVSSTADAMSRLLSNSYPIIISDIYIDDRTGLDVLESAKRSNPNCSVILMTARGSRGLLFSGWLIFLPCFTAPYTARHIRL